MLSYLSHFASTRWIRRGERERDVDTVHRTAADRTNHPARGHPTRACGPGPSFDLHRTRGLRQRNRAWSSGWQEDRGRHSESGSEPRFFKQPDGDLQVEAQAGGMSLFWHEAVVA